MNLNHHEISPLIIEARDHKNLGNASYDLSAGTIVDMKGLTHTEFYKIPPQGMVYVISKEKIKVPSHVIGFAHVKTALTQKGIMATNIGIVDSGYEGYISTLLINFGEKEWTININTKYLRLTFNLINDLPPGISRKPVNINFTKEEYLALRRNDTDYLEEKFLNLGDIERNVKKSLFKLAIGLSIFFAAGSFAVAMYFQQKTSSEKNVENTIRNYETRVQVIQEENRTLQIRMQNLQAQIDTIRH